MFGRKMDLKCSTFMTKRKNVIVFRFFVGAAIELNNNCLRTENKHVILSSKHASKEKMMPLFFSLQMIFMRWHVLKMKHQ